MTNYKKVLKPFFFSMLLVSTSMVQAVTIGFDTLTQSTSSIDVAVVISELGSGEAPSIATYDFDVKFDQNHLLYSEATFGDPIIGNQLDVLAFGFNEQSASINSAGNLNIFELSFDTVDDLNTLQADSFTLATLTFDILKAETSQLEIIINDLSDTEANELTATLISETVTTVPVPPAFLLMASGLGLLYKNKKTVISHVA